MLCKIWCFYGGDYEECRLRGYKNPVRTSGDSLRFHYRAQHVNAMQDLRCPRRWLWRMSSPAIKKPGSYLTGDTLRLCYRIQSVNAVQELRLPRRRLWRMPSSRMWRHVAVVTTDVRKGTIVSIIRLKRLGELGRNVSNNYQLKYTAKKH
jgi:hypothetical protein